MAAMARPAPVFPLVPSMIVPPGFSRPFRSASSIIASPIRSLTEPPGLKNSTLARTVQGRSAGMALSRTSGVLPIVPSTFSCHITARGESRKREAWKVALPAENVRRSPGTRRDFAGPAGHSEAHPLHLCPIPAILLARVVLMCARALTAHHTPTHMDSESADVIPLLAPELLAATATARGERLGSNAAWDAVFGRDGLWDHLELEDRRFADEYVAEAAAGSMVTHQVFLIARHHADLPAPVLLHFLPVRLPTADPGAMPVVITGEVLQEPKRWAADQTKRRRMEMLGQMAMGIAHDFNNLLTSVLGHVELLQGAIAGVPEVPYSVAEQLRTIERAGLDGAALVRKIQRYIRNENQERFEPLDLATIVDEVASLTRPYWQNEPRREGIEITLHAELDDVPPIRGAEA